MYEPSSRDGLLALGVGAVLSARHFYRQKRLRPFQLSVIVAWPALGVAIMQTVINNSTPHTVEVLKAQDATGEGAAQAHEASAVLAQRLRHLAQSSDSSSSSSSSLHRPGTDG